LVDENTVIEMRSAKRIARHLAMETSPGWHPAQEDVFIVSPFVSILQRKCRLTPKMEGPKVITHLGGKAMKPHEKTRDK